MAMADLDYGESRALFAPCPFETVIFDKDTRRMICKDRHGKVTGYPVKTAAERHKEWHEQKTKDEMVLFFKKQHESSPLDYIINPFLFEQDMEFAGEFAGGLSDESKAVIEGMREDITAKHKAHAAGEGKKHFAGLYAERAAEEKKLRKSLGGRQTWQ
jgi:hypothetical protein